MTAKIDYKKELESAAKGMILIHDPRLLIKLIVRSIVQRVHMEHAGNGLAPEGAVVREVEPVTVTRPRAMDGRIALRIVVGLFLPPGIGAERQVVQHGALIDCLLR